MFYSLLLTASLLFGRVNTAFVGMKGGTAKCTVCPQCTVCNPFMGCQYVNFGGCKNKVGKAGVCYYGNCNTTLKVPKTPLPVCKTYDITQNPVKIVNGINGLDCSTLGSIFGSVCISGRCTPFVDGFDQMGFNTGCLIASNGTICDTNGIFTDGEVCMGGLCTMAINPQNKCIL
jgi:hypothetical protein